MPAQRVEIITGHERRRTYSDMEKARMVAEASQPGASVAEVARRHNVSASLLYRWRRHGPGGHGARLRPSPPLIPVRIGPEDNAADGLAIPDARTGSPPVEIALPNGVTVRVDQTVDAKALRRILAALRE